MSIQTKVQEILDKFKVNLSVSETQKFATATLDSGQVIQTDAEAFAEGANVYIVNDEGEQIPLPNGNYTLEDGTSFMVVDGVIGAAEESEDEPAETAPAMDELMAAIRPLVAEMLAAALQPIIEQLEAAKPQEFAAEPAPLKRTPVTPKPAPQKVDLSKMTLEERVATIQNQFN